MKKFAGIALAALALATTTGCYRTQEGRVGAGVPFAKDTIESRYERPASQLFEAAKATLAYNGTPTSEDVVRKTLAAKVNNRSVFIKVEELEPNISRIFVQARKSGGRGDIILASELDKRDILTRYLNEIYFGRGAYGVEAAARRSDAASTSWSCGPRGPNARRTFTR
jgi:hypothetical protein